MTHAEQRAAAPRVLRRPGSTRASDAGPHAGQWDNTGADGGNPRNCGTRRRSSSASRTTPSTRSRRRWRTKPGEVLGVPAPTRAASAARRRSANSPSSGVCRPRRSNAWDVAFYSERLKRERLQVSEEELRPYFPLPRVLAGLFAVASRLYGIRIVRAQRRRDCTTRTCGTSTSSTRDGTPRGGFFLDLYARPRKRGGAWMDECVGRMRLGPMRRRCRSRTSSATSRRPPAGSRRCSRTTRC